MIKHMKSTCKFSFCRKYFFFKIFFYNFVTENIFYLISLYPQEQAFFWWVRAQCFFLKNLTVASHLLDKGRLRNHGDFVSGEPICVTNYSILHCVYLWWILKITQVNIAWFTTYTKLDQRRVIRRLKTAELTICSQLEVKFMSCVFLMRARWRRGMNVCYMKVSKSINQPFLFYVCLKDKNKCLNKWMRLLKRKTEFQRKK